jgi:hypothetical protein
MASKIPIGQGNFITTAGRAGLLKYVTTCQAIYPLAALPLPKGTLKALIKLMRVFL